MTNIEKLFLQPFTDFDFGRWEDTLDSMFKTVADVAKPFLPYNVVKNDNGATLELAVAGYDKSDLEVEVRDGYIRISGKTPTSDEKAEFIHKGIASRGFGFDFPFSPMYTFKEASLKDGMLRIMWEHSKKDTNKKVDIK